MNAIEGTPFQKKVWSEIAKIPKGSVRTYGDIAKKIGHPKAYRAVASACARNKLYPNMVPCHRVVPSNGTIGKYTPPGGVAKKLELLRNEGVDVTKFKR